MITEHEFDFEGHEALTKDNFYVPEHVVYKAAIMTIAVIMCLVTLIFFNQIDRLSTEKEQLKKENAGLKKDIKLLTGFANSNE